MTKERFRLLLRANDYDLKNNDLFIESINEDEVTFKLVNYSESSSSDVKSKTISIKELEADSQEIIECAYNEKGAKEIIEAWNAYNV